MGNGGGYGKKNRKFVQIRVVFNTPFTGAFGRCLENSGGFSFFQLSVCDASERKTVKKNGGKKTKKRTRWRARKLRSYTRAADDVRSGTYLCLYTTVAAVAFSTDDDDILEFG